MPQMIFVNLPVKDLRKSRAFFAALGYTFNEQFSDDTGACVVVSDTIYVMLLTEPKFAGFSPKPITDTSKSIEVLTCLSCDSRAQVDDLVAKAVAAGGKTYKKPMDYGFMYGQSFLDLDGHVWELVWMDPRPSHRRSRPRVTDLATIRARLDEERRSLVRRGERIEKLPEVTRVQNGSQHSIAWSALDASNADAVIDREIAHYRAHGVEFEWKAYAHDAPGDLLDRLARKGLTIGECEAVMVLDISAGIPDWPMDASCRVQRVDSLQHVADFRRVAETVFGKDYGFTSNQLAEAIAAGSTGHLGFIAYANDDPVSVGRLYTDPNSHFGGLYGGGTLAPYRGRGFYRALLTARAREALKLGAHYLLIDALPTSRPIVERLGFKHLTDTWPVSPSRS